MSASLFSSSWYRVAQLRPRLRAQAEIVRHVYRGERWYVLQDMASGRFLRLNPQAYRVVAQMDGQRTLEELWQAACLALGDEAPTQDEVLGLLSQLHQANVLLTDRQPDLDELGERGRRTRRQKLKQYLSNPLSLKLPLFDPDPLLARVVGLVPRWAGPWLLLAWLGLVVSGLVQAGLHWDELTRDLTSRVFTAENMLVLALAFPVLKAIHEFGHGLALKAYGRGCHEMGLMFLVLMPVPYVDASQASALPRRGQRMVVGLAGMMIEMAVAAVALWLWTAVSPGVLKALLHEVVILAGVTTVVFNANPLLRFDGYYVLADGLEIPNLGQKANRYLGYLVQRHLLGVREGIEPPPMTRGEPLLLITYAITSFIYRTAVSVAIVLLVAGKFFFIGVLLALWSAYGVAIAPLVRHLQFLARDPALDGHRQRSWLVAGGLVLALGLMVGVVPAPSWTSTEGVIWMPEQSHLRAHRDCFGSAVLAQPGSPVKAGDPLIACTDPELEANVAQARARSSELQSRFGLATTTDRVQARMVEAEMAHQQTQMADLRTRRDQLVIRSPHDGIFVMSSPADLPGRYLRRGDVQAYVLDPSRFTLLTVVPQGEVDLVRSRTIGVELRTVDRIWDLLSARIEREVPAATTELPSLALALQGGGKIGLDPDSRGDSAPKALSSLFQFELRSVGGEPPRTLGSRVFVRFVHESEPLARQWYRSLRQQFLKRFAL